MEKTTPSNTPKRPNLNRDQIEMAIDSSVVGMAFTASEFAAEYSKYDDSYELAKKLEENQGCEISRTDLDDIDVLMSVIDDAQKKLVKDWFAANNIQPPFPIGSTLKEGVITGIYQYEPAVYEVKVPDDENPTRRWLIRFENAVLVEEVAA